MSELIAVSRYGRVAGRASERRAILEKGRCAGRAIGVSSKLIRLGETGERLAHRCTG